MTQKTEMPSDEYATVGSGALKLKGAKVKKHKKKKDKVPDLEKALSTGESSSAVEKRKKGRVDDEEEGDEERAKSTEADDEFRPVVQKTEAERRFEEARLKKVCLALPFLIKREFLVFFFLRGR